MKRHWIAMVVAMTVTVGVLTGCGRPDPADTMKRFYMAVQDRRYEEALKCTPKSFRDALETTDPQTGMSRKTTLFSTWDEGMANVVRGGHRIKKIVVIDEHIDGNRATVKFEIHAANGGIEKMEDDLVWEDGAWRLVM